MTYVIVVVVVVIMGGVAWWRRGRPHHEVRMNASYERAKSQAYMQAQNTSRNIGDPFH